MIYTAAVWLLPVIVWAAVAGSRGEASNLHFPSGRYGFVQTLLMTDYSEDPVGYKLIGDLSIDCVHDYLLLVKVGSLRLQIMSRKAPTPHGFVDHASRLEELSGDTKGPWLIRLSGVTSESGQVESIYASSKENLAIINFKRGIASLLQISGTDGMKEEVDASGHCSVSYMRDGYTIVKLKTNCTDPNNRQRSDLNNNVWGGQVDSRRETEAILGGGGSTVNEVVAEEWHTLAANLILDAAFAKLHVKTRLKLVEAKETSGRYTDTDVDSVVERISTNMGGIELKRFTLPVEKEPMVCTHETCPTLAKLVSDNRKNLMAEELGTSKSAMAFIRLVRALKSSSAEAIYTIIDSKENKKILPQLLDVLGSAQCSPAHQAALKKLRINATGKDFNLDLAERYFWALSLAPNPTEAIIRDLVEIVKTGHKNEKLAFTLALTLAATVDKFAQTHEALKAQVVEEVTSLFVQKLTTCSDEKCRLVYLRACSNMATALSGSGPATAELMTTLLQLAVNSTRKSNIAALEALSRTEAWRHHDNAVVEVCNKVYLTNEADSSARTLALDILLSRQLDKTASSDSGLVTLLHPLTVPGTPRELKEYLLQRIAQASEMDRDGFGKQIKRALLDAGVWQWDVFATGGLSTAFDRPVAATTSLSTAQEISNGILKRGTVDINLNHDGSPHSLFTLGLFSSGLGSFVSDSKGADDEVASAGLELRVAGVALRPFVFFTGQTELMGHVWSGTASSSTPAYQALVMLGDTGPVDLALGCGAVAELGITAAASVDLSGQIEISLWNRNAKSLVENSAGLAVIGIFKVETYIVKSQVEFNLLTEPQLDLISDLDFYDGANLCLQLVQPQINVRLNSYKIERIGGSRHRLRKVRYSALGGPTPRSYALNTKNNEMCARIFGSVAEKDDQA